MSGNPGQYAEYGSGENLVYALDASCAMVAIAKEIVWASIGLSIVAHLTVSIWRRQAQKSTGLVLLCVAIGLATILAGSVCLGLLYSILAVCTVYTSQFLWPFVSVVLGILWLFGASHYRRTPPASLLHSDGQMTRVGLTTPGAVGIELGTPVATPVMKVVVPEGIMPGASFAVQLAGGGFLTVVCPPDKKMGDEIAIHVPRR